MVLKQKIWSFLKGYANKKDSSIPLKIYCDKWIFFLIGNHYSYGYNFKNTFNTHNCSCLTITFNISKMNSLLLKTNVFYFKSTESI